MLTESYKTPEPIIRALKDCAPLSVIDPKPLQISIGWSLDHGDRIDPDALIAEHISIQQDLIPYLVECIDSILKTEDIKDSESFWDCAEPRFTTTPPGREYDPFNVWRDYMEFLCNQKDVHQIVRRDFLLGDIYPQINVDTILAAKRIFSYQKGWYFYTGIDQVCKKNQMTFL